MSFQKQAENRDRLVFKVVEMGGAPGRGDPQRKGTVHRGSGLTTGKLVSESLKLPLMYQSGSNFQGEESYTNHTNYSFVKKTSFDAKKRAVIADEYSPITLVLTPAR